MTVVAAGNDGLDLGVSDSPYILTIGATSSDNTLASWSNYGAYVDLVAPGDNTVPTYQSGYAYVSGTSFSAPIVSASLALLAAFYPQLTPSELEALLKLSATDLGASGYDPLYGWGLLNTANAFALAAVPVPASVWLMMSGLFGLLVIARPRSAIRRQA